MDAVERRFRPLPTFAFNTGAPIRCKQCQKVLTAGTNEYISYIAGTEHWEMCYSHVYDMAKQPDNLFRPLPKRMKKGFDLASYINSTFKRMSGFPFSEERAVKTSEIIVELLEIGNLWIFIGDTSQFNHPNQGLAPRWGDYTSTIT